MQLGVSVVLIGTVQFSYYYITYMPSGNSFISRCEQTESYSKESNLQYCFQIKLTV